MTIVKKDFSGLTMGLERALRAQLEQFLGSTAAQLDGPVRRAAEHLSLAAQRGRKDLVDEARDTLLVAMQERKLEAKAGSSGLLQSFITQGIGLLVDGAVAGLNGLKIIP